MDDIVAQAMAKWPNVPAAWGWLRLDRRGHWRLVDRNAPGFSEAGGGEGTRLEHAAFADAICRNYQPDEQGRWYFQNGPQRVFVDLELAPLVFRTFDATRRGAVSDGSDDPGGPDDPNGPDGPDAVAGIALVAHTGVPAAQVRDAMIDAHGNVFVDTDIGPGVVHDADLAALPLAEAADGTMRLRLATGDVALVSTSQDPAERYGFDRRPRAPHQAA